MTNKQQTDWKNRYLDTGCSRQTFHKGGFESILGPFIKQVSEEPRTYGFGSDFRDPFLTPLETSGLYISFETLQAGKQMGPSQDLAKIFQCMMHLVPF